MYHNIFTKAANIDFLPLLTCLDELEKPQELADLLSFHSVPVHFFSVQFKQLKAGREPKIIGAGVEVVGVNRKFKNVEPEPANNIVLSTRNGFVHLSSYISYEFKSFYCHNGKFRSKKEKFIDADIFYMRRKKVQRGFNRYREVKAA